MTNIVLVLTCVLVAGHVVWQHYAVSSNTRGPETPYRSGDRFATVPGLDLSRSDRTLLLIVRSGCGFCTRSMPFYQRLAGGPHDRVRLVVVSSDPKDQIMRYLGGYGLDLEAIGEISPKALRTIGTPTLVLVDKKGTVEGIWIGWLDSAREAQVLAAIGN